MRSRDAEFDACRALLKLGFTGPVKFVDAVSGEHRLSISSIEAGALLTTRENPKLRFAKWKPIPEGGGNARRLVAQPRKALPWLIGQPRPQIEGCMNQRTPLPYRHNGGPPLVDDDAKQRIGERLKHAKHQWRDQMDEMKLKDLNAWWALCLTRLGSEERAKLPDKFTYARTERLKRLYAKLCNFMSADPDNDPGEAWPKQTQLAEALVGASVTCASTCGCLRFSASSTRAAPAAKRASA